jgi:predicted site-specific integrase-resolvase
MQGDKLMLVVAHKDRLARFGFDLIEWMVKRNGGAIVVLNGIDHSPQQELVADLLAIVTVFGARVNGLRRYSKEIKEDPALSNEATGADD